MVLTTENLSVFNYLPRCSYETRKRVFLKKKCSRFLSIFLGNDFKWPHFVVVSHLSGLVLQPFYFKRAMISLHRMADKGLLREFCFFFPDPFFGGLYWYKRWSTFVIKSYNCSGSCFIAGQYFLEMGDGKLCWKA